MAADFLDVASDLTLEFNSKSIEAVRGLVPKEREVEDEIENLCSCGTVIPTARWVKGYDNCLDCARYEEQQAKRYRRSSRLDD